MAARPSGGHDRCRLRLIEWGTGATQVPGQAQGRTFVALVSQADPPETDHVAVAEPAERHRRHPVVVAERLPNRIPVGPRCGPACVSAGLMRHCPRWEGHPKSGVGTRLSVGHGQRVAVDGCPRIGGGRSGCVPPAGRPAKRYEGLLLLGRAAGRRLTGAKKVCELVALHRLRTFDCFAVGAQPAKVGAPRSQYGDEEHRGSEHSFVIGRSNRYSMYQMPHICLGSS
jgi:hypothetical protein